MVAQLIWAPAHDVLPGRAQIAAAQEQLAEDKQSGAPPTVIATDRQQIAVLTGRLDQAQTRDQGLALMVTLGSDPTPGRRSARWDTSPSPAAAAACTTRSRRCRARSARWNRLTTRSRSG